MTPLQWTPRPSFRSLVRIMMFVAVALAPAMARAQATAPSYGFTATAVGSSSQATVTFTFSGSTTVSSIYVLTQGTAGLDFTRNAGAPGTCAATSYMTSSTCTVGVKFAPLYPGVRLGAVALVTSGGTVYYGQLSGAGTGPQAAVYPGTQTTVVPSSGFTGDAYGIAVDANGNIYLANSAAGTIAKYTYSGGTYTASAVGSGLTNTEGLVVDGAGDIFYADETNRRIIEETYNPSANTYTQSTVIGTTNIPTSLAMDSAGTLYIGVGPTLQYLTANGSGGFNSAVTIDNTINTFNGIAVDISGNVYVNDGGTGILYKETYSGGTYTRSTITTGLGNNNGIAVDASGIVYVSAQGTATSILRYQPTGSTYTQLTSLGSFSRNNGVALDGAGNLYVTDDYNNVNSVAKITVNGTQTLAAGSTLTTGLTYLTETLTNIGNANLSFVVPTTGNTNPTVTGTGFTYDTTNSTCPQMTPASAATVLAPAGYCTAIADFQPTSATTYTGTLTSKDNSLNATTIHTSNLTGTGVTPNTTLALTESQSGSQIYGVTQLLTATVNPSSSSGTVLFYANGVAISSAVTPSGGVATYSYTPNVGTYSYTAIFTGSGASTSSNMTHLTVVQAAQTIAFTQPTTPAYPGGSATLSATASSGLAVTFTLLSGPATLAGSTVSYTGTGTVVIAANQAGNGNYSAAPQVTRSVTVQTPPTYTVTTTTDTAGTASNCNDTSGGATAISGCSLHDAFAAANATGIIGTSYAGVTINFAPALSGQTLSITSMISATANFNLSGPGASSLTLQAHSNGYNFISSVTGVLAMSVSGLTIKGFANIYSVSNTNGGAWSATVSGHKTTFSDVIFTGNSISPSGYNGGAVYEANGTVSIANSSFFGNTATGSSGGALYLGTSATTITSSTFGSAASPNSSNSGGAIFATAGSLAITGTSFTSNAATSVGGAVDASSTATTLTGDTFTSNSAASSGGAVYETGAALTVTSSVFLSNTATTYGGAISKLGAGNLTVTQSSFGSTASNGNSAPYAGAIYLVTVPATGNAPSITNSNFLYNKGTSQPSVATGGGAIFITGTNATGSITLGANNFIGNTQAGGSTAYGGALMHYRNSSKNRLILQNNLFQNNATTCTTNPCNSYGGAIYASTPSSAVYAITGETFAGNTFTGNSANVTPASGNAFGGAVWLSNNNVTGNIDNNTFVSNSALGGATDTAGGIYLTTTATTTTFYNNIVAKNNGGASSNPDAYLGSAANNCSSGYCNSATTANATNNTNTTLTALGNYGGPTIGATGYTLPTYTLLPLPGSSALAAGDTTYTSVSNQTCSGATAAVDARGCGYSRQVGTLIDGGAAQANYALLYTQQPTKTVSGTAFSPSPAVQLYESGLAFTAASGSPIRFTPGTNSPYLLSVGTANLNAAGIATLAASPTSAAPANTYVSDNTLLAIVQNAAGATDTSATSSPFAITDSSANTIRYISGPPTASAQGGNAGTVKVGLYAAGSATPDPTATASILVTFKAPDNSTNGFVVSAVNGVATFNTSSYTLSQNGTYTITASASNYTSDTAEEFDTVSSTAAFAGFTQSLAGSPFYPGVGYTLTLKAVDQYGATYTGFTGIVSVTAGDTATTIVPATYTFAAADAGVHTFTVTFGAAGTRTLTATASGAVNSASFSVLDYIWLLNANGTVTKASESGASVVAAAGSMSAASTRGGLAIDSAGNIWSVTTASNALDFVTRSGTGSAMYSGGGLNAPASVAIDGLGSVWVANSGANTVSAFSNSGTAQSTTLGYGAASLANAPTAIAIDGTGGVWVTGGTGANSSLTHIIGAAAPVVTPQATAVTNATTGARP